MRLMIDFLMIVDLGDRNIVFVRILQMIAEHDHARHDDHGVQDRDDHQDAVSFLNDFLRVQDLKRKKSIISVTVQNFKKRIICSLSVLCSQRLILTRSPQISGQNKSEAREPERLVKITFGIVASSLFKRAGNSNQEIFLIVLLEMSFFCQQIFKILATDLTIFSCLVRLEGVV